MGETIWGIHTQDDLLFLHDGVIAVGWREMGDLSLVEPTREAFKLAYGVAFPDAKKGNVATNAGQLYRFVCEASIGDYVIFPSKSDRKINIGQIEGSYAYCPDAVSYPHQRKVRWIKRISRTSFSQGALYEVGSALTIFSLKNYSDEFLGALDDAFDPNALTKPGNVDDSIASTADEIVDATRDFILKELSKHLKGYDLEYFVANLLEAMGYRANVSPQGGDSGVDITAYKDELPPRILVQVKSQDSDIKEATIQSLKGAMREGDYGLFVSLSGYTKNARKYLDSTPIIRGIDGTELVDLILKYYEHLDARYRAMIPLRKVYIPVPEAE